jgi:hypothetical protein
MTLAFLGEVGVYLPWEDGIKLTAISDGSLRQFIVTRAALIAAGANPTLDPASLLVFFEQNRPVFEAAAANVLPQLSLHWLVRPEDVARSRLAPLAARVNGLKV